MYKSKLSTIHFFSVYEKTFPIKNFPILHLPGAENFYIFCRGKRCQEVASELYTLHWSTSDLFGVSSSGESAADIIQGQWSGVHYCLDLFQKCVRKLSSSTWWLVSSNRDVRLLLTLIICYSQKPSMWLADEGFILNVNHLQFSSVHLVFIHLIRSLLQFSFYWNTLCLEVPQGIEKGVGV